MVGLLITVVFNIVLYVVFRTGLNKRIKDPQPYVRSDMRSQSGRDVCNVFCS